MPPLTSDDLYQAERMMGAGSGYIAFQPTPTKFDGSVVTPISGVRHTASGQLFMSGISGKAAFLPLTAQQRDALDKAFWMSVDVIDSGDEP